MERIILYQKMERIRMKRTKKYSRLKQNSQSLMLIRGGGGEDCSVNNPHIGRMLQLDAQIAPLSVVVTCSYDPPPCCPTQECFPCKRNMVLTSSNIFSFYYVSRLHHTFIFG
ncbi:hypothetical protein LIER_03930 [Lithospermum erythrorhizon]|uniref:Uncharacterized protein n=1 Tax=Lithospermum erythrorhizon TaxID=34254 RepID=A0AAV3NZK3_LITER